MVSRISNEDWNDIVDEMFPQHSVDTFVHTESIDSEDSEHDFEKKEYLPKKIGDNCVLKGNSNRSEDIFLYDFVVADIKSTYIRVKNSEKTRGVTLLEFWYFNFSHSEMVFRSLSSYLQDNVGKGSMKFNLQDFLDLKKDAVVEFVLWQKQGIAAKIEGCFDEIRQKEAEMGKKIQNIPQDIAQVDRNFICGDILTKFNIFRETKEKEIRELEKQKELWEEALESFEMLYTKFGRKV